jgi:DHA2 family multidrug resistance protein
MQVRKISGVLFFSVWMLWMPALAQQLNEMVQGLTSRFALRHGSGPEAVHQAYAAVYAMMQKQATVLGYQDTILAMAALTVIVMPLVLLARKPAPGEIHAGH